MEPEEQAVERLASSWPQISATHAEYLQVWFGQLRAIDEELARPSPRQLHESLWAALGLLNRCYELMLCSIDQISTRNLNGFYAGARGLVETLSALVWVNEKPERLCSLVQFETPRIGRLLNAGYQKYPIVKQVYSNMSSVVHPSRGSHLLSPRPVEDRRDRGAFGPFGLDFSASFCQRMVADLIKLGQLIARELETLVSQDAQVFSGGRLMVEIVEQGRDEA